MNLRSVTAKALVCAAVVAAAVPTVAGQAYAGGNGNTNGSCGTGFTLSTVSDLAADAYTWYGGDLQQWTAYLAGVDKNGDGSLCWHYIGKTCPCGANDLVVVDDNAEGAVG